MKSLLLLSINLLTVSFAYAMQTDKVKFEKYTIIGTEKRKILEQDSDDKSYVISKVKDLKTGKVSWLGEVSDIPPIGVWHKNTYSPDSMPESCAKIMYYKLRAALRIQSN